MWPPWHRLRWRTGETIYARFAPQETTQSVHRGDGHYPAGIALPGLVGVPAGTHRCAAGAVNNEFRQALFRELSIPRMGKDKEV